jgi:hypothetical protein
MMRGARPAPTEVLELRVHGVNNTTAAALLDLRPEDVERVAGDRLGSFWRPTPSALAALRQGQRGFVPPGIVREAYSWGGMVRTTPDLGRAGAAGIVAATIARVFYALILPFSIGNAVQWARRISSPGDARPTRFWAAVTAGTGRLFGLLLTLLFTATAITLAVDVLAAQCGAEASLCSPIAAVLEPFSAWTTAQRFALFSLVPVLAIVALWLLSAVASVRYDVLPGMEWNGDGTRTPEAPTRLWQRLAHRSEDVPMPADAPKAVLAHPGFWANRIVGNLARVHLAAALLLTTAVVAVHGAMRWYTDCTGLGGIDACIGEAASEPAFLRLLWLAIGAGVLLIAGVVLVCAIPTMTIVPHERAGVTWYGIASAVLLGAAVLAFALLLVFLVFFTGIDTRPPERLYGGGVMVIVIVTAAAVVALTGVFWRPFRGRRTVGWAGCGPAVFMTIALVVAVATSAIVVVTAGDWLNGSKGAAALVRGDTIAVETVEPATTSIGEVTCAIDPPLDGLSAGDGFVADCTMPDAASQAMHELTVPSGYVSLGSLIVLALVVGLGLALLAAFRSRSVVDRALAWGAPASDNARIVEVDDGVLPVSQRGLYRRIAAKRTTAARLHTVEPLSGFLTTVMGVATVAGIVWTWVAYAVGAPLWEVVPFDLDEAVVRTFLAVALPALAWIGLLLVAALASGSLGNGPRPLGIVWDIACYLPRTGHPFGPPSYAERAVPEIAGRMFAWLRESDTRRVVLSAHSMGGVLAVSAIGLLSSSPDTRKLLSRVRLLTFGVQLRAFFGRMLPELLGPAVLGTEPSLAPRALAADPWADDVTEQTPTQTIVTPKPPYGRLKGTLVTGAGVRWLSLWRFTDYLGFPAASTSPVLPNGNPNAIDRFAEELDLSGYMVEVGTHGEYYRVPAYEKAVHDLIGP